MQGSPGPKRPFTATVPPPQAHPYLTGTDGTEPSFDDEQRDACRYLNKSSNALRALVGACDLVSRSTVVRGS